MPNLESLGLADKLFAYTLTDLIALKLRSLLQQAIRNRTRRHYVFDKTYDAVNGFNKSLPWE